jgi:hypothetical protein
MQKIALCFLTYENLSQPKLWSRIINNNKNKLNVYIHNKNDFIDNEYKLHEYCIQNKVETNYANKSLVEATLILFKEAYKDETNCFFILLSDKCIPLYNFEYIYKEIFISNSNIISSIHTKDKRYGFLTNPERYQELTDPTFLTIKKTVKDSQWLSLNRTTVNFFIENNFLNMYSDKFFAVDEHYFGNICIKFNIPYLNRKITFVNWLQKSDNKSDRQFPKTYEKITHQMLKKIMNQKVFFLRKVSSNCILPPYFDKLS